MFDLTLNARSNILNGITCYETVNIEILNKLINSDLLKTTFNNPMSKYFHDDERQQLNKYKMIIDKKTAIVKYKRTKGMSYGRVFPFQSLSLYSIRRELRQTMAKEYYEDIDIENCHPSILLQICEANNIPCKYLKRYVKNRSEIISEVMQVFNVDRETTKKLFIRLMYIGSFKKWLKENNKEEMDNSICKYIKKFKNEMNEISKIITENNKKLKYEIEEHKKENGDDDYNINSTCLSYYLQEYECIILETMYNYLRNIGIIVNNNCVLCADGIMIPKDKYNDRVLILLSDEVYKQNGFRLNFTNKPMEQDYINILNEHTNNITYSVGTYENKKEMFEKTHFKCMNPIGYCEIEDGEVIIRKKNEFTQCYENIILTKSIKKNDELVEKEYSFVDKWYKDPEIRTYKSFDFHPKCNAPDGVYNLFNGFKAEKEPVSDIQDIKDTKMWDHMLNLCGRDEAIFNYLLKWVSHIVQKPYKRIGTCLLIRSIQGTGKDTFFDFVGHRLLGSRYYFNNANFELIFGRFNSMLENKILIVGNEVNASDTNGLFGKVINTITSPKISIERKGISAYETNNCSAFVFLTNNDFPFKIPESDRRFICWESSPDIANDPVYFKALYDEIESGKIDRLFYDFFNNYDIEDFKPSADRPASDVYTEMKEMSTPPYVNFLDNYTMMNKGKILNYKSQDIFYEFKQFIDGGNYKYEMSLTKFIIKLKQYNGVDTYRTSKFNGVTINVDMLRQDLIKKKQIIDLPDIEFIEDATSEYDQL
jgi:hypothetical protein